LPLNKVAPAGPTLGGGRRIDPSDMPKERVFELIAEIQKLGDQHRQPSGNGHTDDVRHHGGFPRKGDHYQR
jgi:hypothetical protein